MTSWLIGAVASAVGAAELMVVVWLDAVIMLLMVFATLVMVFSSQMLQWLDSAKWRTIINGQTSTNRYFFK